MLKFTKPWKKQTSHLIISWISSFSYLTPESPPRIAGGHRHFLPLLDTRGVTVWPVDVLNLKYRFYPSNLCFFVLQNSWNFCGNWFNFWKALNVHLCHPFAVGGRSWLEEQRQWWGLGARCAVGRMLRYLDWKSILRKAGWQNPSPGGRFANLCNFKKWSKTPLNELISSTAFVRDWNASIWYTYINASDFRCKACWVYCKRDLAKTEVLVGQHLFCSIFLYFYHLTIASHHSAEGRESYYCNFLFNLG